MTEPVTARGRPAVAASILAAALLGIYFAASWGDLGSLPAGYLITAAAAGIAFWFPSQRIGSPREVLAQWRSLLPWILAWTLAWDLATAGIIGHRELFDRWWLVYPAAVLFVGILLAIHGAVLRRRGASPD